MPDASTDLLNIDAGLGVPGEPDNTSLLGVFVGTLLKLLPGLYIAEISGDANATEESTLSSVIPRCQSRAFCFFVLAPADCAAAVSVSALTLAA